MITGVYGTQEGIAHVAFPLCNPGDIAEVQGTRYVVLDRRPGPETGVVYLDCRSDKP